MFFLIVSSVSGFFNLFIFYFYFFSDFLIFLKNTYLFLAVLGLHCFAWAFSSFKEWGLLFIVVCKLLIVVPSLVAEHGC